MAVNNDQSQASARAAANLAASARRQQEIAEEHRRALVAEYGPDHFSRGDVLIFRPHPEDADQETRVAVKIDSDRWTLTARGSSRTWVETLVLAGAGHQLAKCGSETPVGLVIGIATVSEAP